MQVRRARAILASMSDAALKLMTSDDFLLWRLDREGTWELIDGVPRLKFDNGPNMMAGGRRSHARVAANILIALGVRLSGGPCYPVGSDLAVRVTATGTRQPDVTIECDKGSGDDLEASKPTVLFEVLSPSTRGVDLIRKTEEYKNLPSARHIVLLEADRAATSLWTRGDDAGWRLDVVQTLGGVLELVAVGVSLPLAEVYKGVPLTEPR